MKIPILCAAIVAALTLASTVNAQDDDQAKARDGIQPTYTFSVAHLKRLVDEISGQGYGDRAMIGCMAQHTVQIIADTGDHQARSFFLFGKAGTLDETQSTVRTDQ